MLFPYSVTISEDPSSGDYFVFRRPELPIRLIGPRGSEDLVALVDTGADRTIFPLGSAARLGIETFLSPGAGANDVSGRPIELLAGEAVLELEREGELIRWHELVWFHDFPLSNDAVILGHAGFLDYFTAEFDGKLGVLSLTPNDDLPSADFE